MNAVIQEPVAAVQTVPLLIDGEFVESRSTQWRDIVNPATQQVLARVPFATAEEIDAAIEAAQAAFASWKNTPLGARVRVMLRFQALVREHMPRIAKVLTAEQGKTLPDAEGDIFRGLEVVEHACSIGTLQLGEFAENVAGSVDTYTLRPADRRVRRHHAVQLPGDDPAVDVPDGDRLRQHLRAQALRAGSAVDHAAGPSWRSRPACPRACSTWCTAARRRSTRSAPTRT